MGKICPKCGNGIPEESNGVCYTCARIEGEQKRYGKRRQGRGYGDRGSGLLGWKWHKPTRRRKKWEPWKLGGQPSNPATRPAKRLSRGQRRLKPHKKKSRKKPRKETKKSTSTWKPTPKPVNVPNGPMDYREVRKGINRFLEQLYMRQTYLSTILERQGLTSPSVKRLQSKEYLQDFLQLLMVKWRWWLKEYLPPVEVEMLRRYYGFDGKGMRSFTEISEEDDVTDSQVRLRWKEAMKRLSGPQRRKELERRTVQAARELLGA